MSFIRGQQASNHWRNWGRSSRCICSSAWWTNWYIVLCPASCLHQVYKRLTVKKRFCSVTLWNLQWLEKTSLKLCQAFLKKGLSWVAMVGCATDGAPAVLGCGSDFQARVRAPTPTQARCTAWFTTSCEDPASRPQDHTVWGRSHGLLLLKSPPNTKMLRLVSET